MEYTQSIANTKKAEIMLIGNELLIGITRDINAFWLGKQLTNFGISVVRVTIIRDDVDEIGFAFNEAIARAPDYLLTSGGLGPTFDDMTIQAIAKARDINLVKSDEVIGWLEERYGYLLSTGMVKETGLNDARRKMALIPEGSTPLKNNAGSAPCIFIEIGPTKVFILPGVPREVQALFSEQIVPILQQESEGIRLYERRFVVEGVGESTVSAQIVELMKELDDRIWIKSHAKYRDGHYYMEMHVSGYGIDTFEQDVDVAATRVREIVASQGGQVREMDEEKREPDRDAGPETDSS
jgi:molybdenum cofactor synthesis domain-containing protein